MKLAIHYFLLAAVGPSAAMALTLDDVIGAALSNSPALHSEDYKIESASAQAGQAASAWYPQVKAGAQYARTDNPPQAFFMNLNQQSASLETDFNNPPDTDNLRLGASAAWMLYDGGQRTLDVRMAQLGAEGQRLGRLITVNELVHNITRGWYGAMLARDAVAVAEKAEKSWSESLRLARELVSAGAAVKSDVLSLEVKLAEARQQQEQAKNGCSLAVSSLNAIMGQGTLTVDSIRDVQSNSMITSPNTNSNVSGRAELQAASLMTRIKETALLKARRQYTPTVSAFSEFDWDSDVGTDMQGSYLAGVAVDVNLFDGWRTRQGIARAKAELESARAEEEQARDMLTLDLTRARLSLDDAQTKLEVSKSNIINADEALRMTRARYQQGAANIAELLGAETMLSSAQFDAVAAEYGIRVAQSDIVRAQGLYAVRYSEGAKP